MLSFMIRKRFARVFGVDWQELWRALTQPAKVGSVKPVRLQLEGLEGRDIPAVTASLSGGVLSVLGDSANNTIVIRQISSTNVEVAGIRITDGGQQVSSVNLNRVSKIVMNAGDGADWSQVIFTTSAGRRPTELNGGAGNDTVYGGAGNDLIHGGTGNDKVFAGAGDDALYGDDGDDFLDGGSGSNTVVGGGGSYDFNAQVVAVNGAAYDDIHQRQSPTCAFLASLSAVARTVPDLPSRITHLGETNYSVRLYKDGTLINQRVSFDGSWDRAHDPDPATEGESWVIIFQRAYIASQGQNPRHVGIALTAITGKRVEIINKGNAFSNTDMRLIRRLLEEGRSIVADTPPQVAAGSGLVANHAYTVIGVVQRGADYFIRMRNPWGRFPSGDGVVEVSLNTVRSSIEKFSYV